MSLSVDRLYVEDLDARSSDSRNEDNRASSELGMVCQDEDGPASQAIHAQSMARPKNKDVKPPIPASIPIWKGLAFRIRTAAQRQSDNGDSRSNLGDGLANPQLYEIEVSPQAGRSRGHAR
jgi:hypothetical protein